MRVPRRGLLLLLLLVVAGVAMGDHRDDHNGHDDHDHDEDHDHDHYDHVQHDQPHHEDDGDHGDRGDSDHGDHGDHGDRDRHHDQDHGHHDLSDEFSALDDRLDAVTARIEHIHDVIRRRVDPRRVSRARSINARVQKLEGSGCDDRHMQCGGSDPECQPYLFVCDGRKDCRNGADEAFCELPTKKGDYFEGHMIWDTCTTRKPDVIGFEVMDVKTYDYFTPMVKLHANILLEYENELIDGQDSLPAVGHYHLGRHVVALDPPEDDRLGLYCVFDGFDADRCHGYIAHEASMDVCAEFIFVRQH